MKTRRIGRLLGLAPAIVCFWSMFATPALAKSETTISADLDYAHSAGSDIGGGWGFGARLGQRFHVPLVALDPEIGFTFHDFNKGLSPTMYRGILGLRLGFLEVIRPGIYGHVGIGRINFDTLPDASHTAFTYDFGLFLDLTVIPLLDVGLHASYDGIAAGDQVDAVKWVTLGAHAALVF
jgi:hypothetical protein